MIRGSQALDQDFFGVLLSQNPYKTLHFFTFLTRRAKRAGEKVTLVSQNPYKTLHFLTSLTRRAKRTRGFPYPLVPKPL